MKDFETTLDEKQEKMWDQAVKLFLSGNMAAAAEIFLHLAKADYKGAAFMVGSVLSDSTNGSKANLEEAMFWYQKAVDDEKDTEAMLALAALYVSRGGAEDATKAVKLIEQAAEMEDIGALSTLGSIYEDGYMNIVLPDVQAAEAYFARAAAHGGVYAMLRLSNLSWGKRHLLRWLYWRMKAIWTTLGIAITNPEDARLMGVGSFHRINGGTH